MTNTPENAERSPDTYARDELAAVIVEAYGEDPGECPCEQDLDVAAHILKAGYRQIFDGDCGLGNIKDPTEREAAEAWMRWANLVNRSGGEPNGIAAMKQMLTEFGYRKPRIITTPGELDALPFGSIVLDSNGDRELKVNTPQSWLELRDYGALEDSVNLPATVLYEPTK